MQRTYSVGPTCYAHAQTLRQLACARCPPGVYCSKAGSEFHKLIFQVGGVSLSLRGSHALSVRHAVCAACASSLGMAAQTPSRRRVGAAARVDGACCIADIPQTNRLAHGKISSTRTRARRGYLSMAWSAAGRCKEKSVQAGGGSQTAVGVTKAPCVACAVLARTCGAHAATCVYCEPA